MKQERYFIAFYHVLCVSKGISANGCMNFRCNGFLNRKTSVFLIYERILEQFPDLKGKLLFEYISLTNIIELSKSDYEDWEAV